MSIVANERQVIQKTMDYIEDERARLWKDYMKMVDRMRELDEIDKLENPPVVEKQPEVAVLTLKEAIAVHNEVFHPVEQKKIAPPLVYSEVSSNLHASQNQMLKDADYDNRPVKVPRRRSKYRDVKAIAHDVKSILKGAGRPMQVKEILTKLEEKDISTANPYSLLHQVQQYDKNIQKAKFGYYQYKG